MLQVGVPVEYVEQAEGQGEHDPGDLVYLGDRVEGFLRVVHGPGDAPLATALFGLIVAVVAPAAGVGSCGSRGHQAQLQPGFLPHLALLGSSPTTENGLAIAAVFAVPAFAVPVFVVGVQMALLLAAFPSPVASQPFKIKKTENL